MINRGELPRRRLENAVSDLKPFQRRTVSAVVHRMFDADPPQRRFLVADEVGLGKTKIARAVIAETIERLWNDAGIDRIDIVYICSNQQIARQNLRDLEVVSGASAKRAERITMLPAALKDLEHESVNLVAFTPDTSLRFSTHRGRADERAALYHVLSQPNVLGSFMRRSGARNLLKLGAVSFDRALPEARQAVIPAAVGDRYRQILEEEGLLTRFDEYADRRWRVDATEKSEFVGALRRSLARACITFLTPDLIILDEFQRFTSLLDLQGGEDAELAQLLFDQPSSRMLLLSATPYRMLSTAQEDENHVDGFDRTVGFLLGKHRSAEREVLRTSLRELRQGVLGRQDLGHLVATRDRVQEILRSVMVRTERLAATPERDGMLRTDRRATADVTHDDVHAFLGTDRVARTLPTAPSVVEYWKSAPYLYNFMDDYQIKKMITERLDDGSMRARLNGAHMLNWDHIDRYRKINPRNSRLRWLIDDLDHQSAFDVLWVPAAMPQTVPGGSYAKAAGLTKRLIFSGWTVVPKAVAAMVSYEFERHHHRKRQRYTTARNFSGRLVLNRAGDRSTTLALLLPCRRLAELGDAITAAGELDQILPLPISTLRDHVRAQLSRELQPYLEAAATDGPPQNRWYAAAQFLLDDDLYALDADHWQGARSRGRDIGFGEHLERLRAMDVADLQSWGKPPDDLVEVLADLAIAGPAVVALRSAGRVTDARGWTVDSHALHAFAARLAWSFRSLLNTAEADHLITAGQRRQEYWRAVLRHCVDGGLSSVLDEWLHLLPDQRRVSSTSTDPLGVLAEAAEHVLTLEDGRATIDLYDESSSTRRNMRTHFAMRFGQARGATAEGENPDDVRSAFNSPFRPFVLVSTSVGQEGLDFHHYCHAIVHWNLPSNPVDLEQREGRVHRYKGHAVRKNIADKYGRSKEVTEGTDPWQVAFAAAAAEDGDLNPWWIFPGAAAIERLVPTLPLSKEHSKLRELVKATSLYRMTLGQPRQSELLEVLADLPTDQQDLIRASIMIDLSPQSEPSPSFSVTAEEGR